MGGVTQKAVRLGLAAISLSFVALLGPDAQAGEDVPAAGTFRKLAVRKFQVDASTDVQQVLSDLPRLLRHFKPAGAKITQLGVVAEGPRQLPRVTFRATVHVNVDVGVFSVARDEDLWVRADVTTRPGRCAYDATRAGYEVRLDLTSSDEPVSANASSLIAAICVSEPNGATREIELTSFMQIGPDYGRRVAGRLATNMLIQQTDPFVAAVRSAARP
jgi:hypothetical protein